MRVVSIRPDEPHMQNCCFKSEAGVVRMLQWVGSLGDNRGFTKRISLPLKNVAAKPNLLRVVAFVHKNSDQHIVGAAESRIE